MITGLTKKSRENKEINLIENIKKIICKNLGVENINEANFNKYYKCGINDYFSKADLYKAFNMGYLCNKEDVENLVIKILSEKIDPNYDTKMDQYIDSIMKNPSIISCDYVFNEGDIYVTISKGIAKELTSDYFKNIKHKEIKRVLDITFEKDININNIKNGLYNGNILLFRNIEEFIKKFIKDNSNLLDYLMNYKITNGVLKEPKYIALEYLEKFGLTKVKKHLFELSEPINNEFNFVYIFNTEEL